MSGASADRVRCRLVVSGRVQGVYYRASCRDAARELGVDGWVSNRPDGTVEVVAEGSRDAVGALIEWCRQGPPGAVVTDVTVTDEPVARESGFAIR